MLLPDLPASSQLFFDEFCGDLWIKAVEQLVSYAGIRE